MKRITLILILLMPSWAWAENYLCISEEIGVMFPSEVEGQEKWQPRRTDTENRYILKVEDKTMTVHEFSNPTEAYYHSIFCKQAVAVDHRFHCSIPHGQFNFDRVYLRYVMSETRGYYSNLQGIPSIEIGTCTKF